MVAARCLNFGFLPERNRCPGIYPGRQAHTPCPDPSLGLVEWKNPTRKLDELLGFGAESSILQGDDRYEPRLNVQLDRQSLHAPSLTIKSQHRIRHYRKKTPGREQMSANLHRESGDVHFCFQRV